MLWRKYAKILEIFMKVRCLHDFPKIQILYIFDEIFIFGKIKRVTFGPTLRFFSDALNNTGFDGSLMSIYNCWILRNSALFRLYTLM
jgi:hypothetical protein